MKNKISIDYRFFFLMAILLLLIPLKWVIACFLAAFVHEMGHFCAVRLLGGEILGAALSSRGAKMYAPPLSPGKQVVCILAGPLASFSLILFARIYPQIAFCGIVQGVYNLLPLGNLDGRNALNCIKARKKPCKDRKQRVQ